VADYNRRLDTVAVIINKNKNRFLVNHGNFHEAVLTRTRSCGIFTQQDLALS